MSIIEGRAGGELYPAFGWSRLVELLSGTRSHNWLGKVWGSIFFGEIGGVDVDGFILGMIGIAYQKPTVLGKT